MIEQNHNFSITILRAFSVILVLLYHLNFDLFKLGFLGVDIFFVISGYVITLSILNKEKKDNFLKNFFFARFNRIVPPILILLFIVFFFSFLFLNPDIFRSFNQSLFSSVLFISNFYFYLTSNYFSTKSELLPLIHLWSLAVEFQFYLIFPFLFVIKNVRKNLNVYLFFLFLISFFTFVSLNFFDKNFNFYFTGSRFWEFLMGSFAALNFKDKKTNYNFIFFLFATLLIFISLFYDFKNYNNVISIPMICFGSVLIIISTNKLNFKKNKFNNLFLILGTTSFSIYLVHQPLISLYRNISYSNLNLYNQLGLLFLSIFLGIVFSYFFEKKKILSIPNSILIILFLASLSLIVHFSDGFRFRFNDKALKAFDGSKSISKNLIQCRNKEFNNTCIFNGNYKNRAVIWGDSHLSQIDQVLIEVFKEQNFSTQELFLPGCPPFEVKKLECLYNEDYFNNIINDNSIKLVILHAHWILYISEERKNLEYLKNFVLNLSKKKKVVILGDVPKTLFNVPKGLFLKNTWFGLNDFDLSEKPFSIHLKETEVTRDIFLELSNRENIFFYDLSKTFCDTKFDKCFYIKDNLVLYRDDNHLSIDGSKLLEKGLKDFFDNIIRVENFDIN